MFLCNFIFPLLNILSVRGFFVLFCVFHSSQNLRVNPVCFWGFFFINKDDLLVESDIANKAAGWPVKFEFQIDSEYFFFLMYIGPMQYLKHTYTKILFIVFLKCKFNWVACIFLTCIKL